MLSWEALPLPTIRAYLVFLFKEHLQDLLCEKEEIKAPEHHCRLGDIIVFHGVETKSLWTQENKMSWTSLVPSPLFHHLLDSKKGRDWDMSAIYFIFFQQNLTLDVFLMSCHQTCWVLSSWFSDIRKKTSDRLSNFTFRKNSLGQGCRTFNNNPVFIFSWCFVIRADSAGKFRI